jgi:preprotein translocase subunit SecA
MFGFLKRLFGSAQDRQLRQFWKIVAIVNEHEQKLQSLSDQQVRAKTQEFKDRLAKGETVDELLPEAYAVVKNVCRRMWGTDVHVSGYDQKWDMIPFDCQIVGAIAMHRGTIAEMQTGEGKTLTAVMPLYLNALTGKPVHLVTVNDYLVQRDCQWVGAILRWLGLTTAALTGETPPHERRRLYEADVVYGTSSEFGFDYLRDNSTAHRKEQQVQRGHYFAIVDEIDSNLIDEARTPLIISGPVPESRQMYEELKEGVATLVRQQRDLCNRFASEARKTIETILGSDETDSSIKAKRDKKQDAELKEAFRKLWLVNKGTPRNKVLKRLLENPDIRAAVDQWDLYYYQEHNKAEKAQALADLFIIIEEKSNDFELTDKGIASWQATTGESEDDFVMLDLSHEYLKIDADTSLDKDAKAERKVAMRKEDAKRKERAHNLRQMLRANLMMEKDVDYIVQDGKVVIIDEHTGRPQPGRRFSDGLHQSIEAKEGVSIQQETQTYATITLQNYFRMYEKLAGMTGTAATEAHEFMEIYKLAVIEVPPNTPCVRVDANDEIYMTEREKYAAILKEVKEVHGKGRPILIGTESVDVSEKLSRILKQAGVPNTVLNAKIHDKEAEIVAMAGLEKAITISTNMAGRGTDIKLGQGVAQLGGLYVMGTTRHQSRRIDRQLRGRSARQGDPGSSKFFVSFEDQLMRLFASPKLTAVLQRFRPPEGEPISAGILNKSIETAQKRVEQRNYTIRKHTLEYDNVMNKQRQEIYAFRNDVLWNDDISSVAADLIAEVCEFTAADYLNTSDEEGWNPEGYRQWLVQNFPVSFEEGVFDGDNMDADAIIDLASSKVVQAFKDKLEREVKKVPVNPARPQSAQAVVDSALRDIMLRRVDQLWQEHLLNMDHLRADVNLRSVGQKDPLLEFKHEAFALFETLSRNMHSGIAVNLFRFEIIAHDQTHVDNLLQRLRLETNRSLVSELETQGKVNPLPQPTPEPKAPEKGHTIQAEPHAGRNDPCPCGSGKKYKKCCGAYQEEVEPASSKNGGDKE